MQRIHRLCSPLLKLASDAGVRSRRLALLALAVASTAGGCSAISDALTAPTATTSTITVWTSDSSPSYIAVEIDGNVVGTLTAYRNSAPSCGSTTTAGTLSVTVDPGTHTVDAYETSDTGTWGPTQVSLSAGGCQIYELKP